MSDAEPKETGLVEETGLKCCKRNKKTLMIVKTSEGGDHDHRKRLNEIPQKKVFLAYTIS